ncbi:hypothetical protein GCM10028803_00570 [Larkinella knui]|uniref:Uncharacterized protein n=1 Tax=Larkinella knui TaxID=2025310 RepID=A0A3P1CJC9_9BACT|nr:hypothetical protein [Larkinella knui]RRB13461.1 hypothetical protein EHT87_14390 [Larkinella knui]
MSEVQSSLKPYEFLTEDGEVKNKFKYKPGTPKQYRFDGRSGKFNLDGETDIGKKLTITPIAFRHFHDHLFGRKDKDGLNRVDEWFEVFFIDAKNCVSSVMFNNTSVGQIKKVADPLFYDDKTLLDVTLTITQEEKSGPSGKYFAAKFEAEEADRELVAIYRAYCNDFPVFRLDTLTKNAVYVETSDSYFLPDHLKSVMVSISDAPEMHQLPAFGYTDEPRDGAE